MGVTIPAWCLEVQNAQGQAPEEGLIVILLKNISSNICYLS